LVSPQGSAIDISVLRQDKDIAIRVRDTGVGISRDMLPKVFNLFTQVGHSMDRSQGGIGIGLSLVRKLVEIHGGSVVADSEGLGKSSTFTLRLPVLHDTAFRALVEDAANSGQYRPVRQRQVVVVDDNKDPAVSLSMLLEHIGHDVRLSESGQEAVRAAGPGLPRYRLARHERV
jgi:CheY-like chemotaxis protein